MKIIITTIVLLISSQLFAQKNAVIYVKGNEKVTKDEDWDHKINQTFIKEKNKEILKIEIFDNKNVLITKQQTENSNDKSYSKMTDENYFPKYNCKTVNESIFKNEKYTSYTKCVTLKNEVIFSDKECEESSRDINEDNVLTNWLQKRLKDIFEDVDQKIRLNVKFTVDQNYKIEVQEIDDKIINVGNPNLNNIETKLKQSFETIPQKFFTGKLRKIAGKDAVTTFNVPIIWIGSGE